MQASPYGSAATGVVQASVQSGLQAPKAQQPPSAIPTQQLADQADDWARGRGASPALPDPKPAYALHPPDAFVVGSPRPPSINGTSYGYADATLMAHSYPAPPPHGAHQPYSDYNSGGAAALAPQQHPPPPPPPPPHPSGYSQPFYQSYSHQQNPPPGPPPLPHYQQQQPPFGATMPPQPIGPPLHPQHGGAAYYGQQPPQQHQPIGGAPYNSSSYATNAQRPLSVRSDYAPQQPMEMPTMEGLSLGVSNGYGSRAPSSVSHRPNYYAHPEDGPPFKLAVTQPDLKMLANMRDTVLAGDGGDMQKKIAWAKQVLKFIERHQANAGESSRITDPNLVKWTDEALKWILASASSHQPVPLALYLRGDLSASGSFPSYKQKDSKAAFRDFEGAANLGYNKAWFRIGRAYEDHGDVRRAVGAYERGIEKGDCGSTYRLAMAYLLGQIGVVADVGKALALLRRAADTADLDTPQPPYILGMILSGEFESPAIKISPEIVPLDLDEAKWRIERAAFLNFGPAQYKMGFAYEYATLGCPFDPLLSVQYYALASQNGEVEADMALAKWYLCGSEGNFEKNETLAYTFAEKAASRQLPSAEFALGYFKEVGVNGAIDLDQARRWYQRAAAHGNEDAKQRLEALGAGDANALSRSDHESQVDAKLVRKRTQAQARSDARQKQQQQSSWHGPDPSSRQSSVMPSPQVPPPMPSNNYGAYSAQNATLRRKDTLRQVQAAAAVANGSRPSPSDNGIHGPGSRPASGFSTASAPAQSQRQSYQLSDRPLSSAPPTRPSTVQSQPQRMTVSGHQQHQQHQQQQQAASIPIKQKPATFAEMGIATTKAKRDECVIM
ncbi:hypothetical protein OIV83_005206 [Microbotryomycetes sp. JL201]|nr:hypothetical protein OIV83_005206 [Microbotryomycetes sp. JL201]